MKTLDLHGVRHEEVERLLENFILLNNPPLTIITGNSDYMRAALENFCIKHRFQFPLLSDESHEMLIAYGVWGKKKFMGREYMGISRATYIIDENGVIEKVYEKVKTTSHAKDILNDLV